MGLSTHIRQNSYSLHTHTYTIVGAVAVPGGYFASGTGPIWLSRVDCEGHEAKLVYCSSAFNVMQSGTCQHSSDAGVVCPQESGE